VSVGMEMIGAALSANGRRLAYVKGRTVANAFRVPIFADRPATWADATQLTFDEAEVETIDASRDGRLVLSSDRSGSWDLWSMPAAGGDLQQLTRDPAIDAGGRWSRDAKEVVFYSSRTGPREIWVLPMDGGAARQVTRSAADKLYPSWSPDGREIVIQADDNLTIVRAQDGSMRRLTDVPFLSPDWSPDGKWVAFDFRPPGQENQTGGGFYMGRAPSSGGPVELLTKGEGVGGRWAPDGSQIYFAGLGARANNIWRLTLGSREEQPVTNLSGRRGGLRGGSLATDGRYLYFAWGEAVGDVWVAELVRK